MAQRIYSHRFRLILFSLLWLAGLVCGGYIAKFASSSYLLLMRGTISGSVSIVGLLGGVLLPFLCVILCVIISRPKLIYGICFLKACLYSFTGFAMMAAFGSAGWLVRLLLQFTDTGALAVFCWFALRHLDGSRKGLAVDGAVCAALVCCLGWFDYCCVAPILVSLQ